MKLIAAARRAAASGSSCGTSSSSSSTAASSAASTCSSATSWSLERPLLRVDVNRELDLPRSVGRHGLDRLPHRADSGRALHCRHAELHALAALWPEERRGAHHGDAFDPLPN